MPSAEAMKKTAGDVKKTAEKAAEGVVKAAEGGLKEMKRLPEKFACATGRKAATEEAEANKGDGASDTVALVAKCLSVCSTLAVCQTPTHMY